MNFFSGLLSVFAALVLVAQPSFQCTCDWRWRTVDGENVPNTLCYEDQKFIVFKADKKEIVPGDINSEKVVFDVTVSKEITNAGEKEIPGGRKITLEAPTGGHLCGYIDFELGVSGILSVYGPLQNKMDFNACHFYARESEVTPVQRRLMSGKLTCPGPEPGYN